MKGLNSYRLILNMGNYLRFDLFVEISVDAKEGDGYLLYLFFRMLFLI